MTHPDLPDLHQGARPSVEPSEDELAGAASRFFFPDQTPPRAPAAVSNGPVPGGIATERLDLDPEADRVQNMIAAVFRK